MSAASIGVFAFFLLLPVKTTRIQIIPTGEKAEYVSFQLRPESRVGAREWSLDTITKWQEGEEQYSPA